MRKKKPKFMDDATPAIDEIKAEREAQIAHARKMQRHRFDQRCMDRFGMTMDERLDELMKIEDI